MAGFKSSGGKPTAAQKAAIADWGDQRFANIDDLESAAAAAGDAYARSLMSQALQQRAIEQAARGEAMCPECQTPGEPRGEEERSLHTKRGIVTINEPKCYCPKCRRIFFPADSAVRD